jgi:hypothetical protein
MNMMNTTPLQTDLPVIPVNASTGSHVNAVRSALRSGVPAAPDARHPGFYEIEIGDHWYYLHVSDRTPGVYLVAAEKTAARRCA